MIGNKLATDDYGCTENNFCLFFVSFLFLLPQWIYGKEEGFPGERMVVLPPMVVKTEEQDALCQSLFVTGIKYYPHADYHGCTRTDGINQYVFVYCVDGSGFFTVDGRRHEVRKNQYFILPKGKPHEYGATEGGSWTIYWIHFRGTCAHVYVDGLAAPQSINVAMDSRIGDRIDIFEEILSTLQRGVELEDLHYASSLMHHFLASVRYLGQFRGARANADINIVEQAIHFMRENIERHITIDDVLHYVGFSQSHLTTLFKKQMGESPLRYFNRMKIEHAQGLLRTTDLKINQICYKVGIEDALYFSRLFSKIVGMSPTEYRLRAALR